jgi:hypothetical protein
MRRRRGRRTLAVDLRLILRPRKHTASLSTLGWPAKLRADPAQIWLCPARSGLPRLFFFFLFSDKSIYCLCDVL